MTPSSAAVSASVAVRGSPSSALPRISTASSDSISASVSSTHGPPTKSPPNTIAWTSYRAATLIRDRRSRRGHACPRAPRSPARASAAPARSCPASRSPCRRRRARRAGRGRARRRALPLPPAPRSDRPRARARETRAAPPLLFDAGDFDQLRDRFRRLRALAEPVLHLRLVEVDRGGIGLRVVAPDDVEELPVTRRARVGRDDAVDRVLLRAHAGEPQLDCHPFVLL